MNKAIQIINDEITELQSQLELEKRNSVFGDTVRYGLTSQILLLRTILVKIELAEIEN